MNSFLLALLAPLGPFALLLLMAVAFAETGLLAGFLLPADTLLVTAGVLVAAGVLKLPVWLTLPGLAIAAVAGDQLAYLVGRRLGPRLHAGRAPRFLTPGRLESARAMVDRHGPQAVILSRFLPLIRTLTPVLVGAAGMDRRRFILHNLTGATLWAALMFGGGYWLGAFPVVSSHLGLILLAIALISAAPALATWLRARADRRAMAILNPGSGPSPCTQNSLAIRLAATPAQASGRTQSVSLRT